MSESRNSDNEKKETTEPEAEAQAAEPDAAPVGEPPADPSEELPEPDASPEPEASESQAVQDSAAEPGGKASSIVVSLLTTLMVLAVVGAGLYATLPQWRDNAAAMLGLDGARKLSGRMAMLEEAVGEVDAEAEALAARLEALSTEVAEARAAADAGGGGGAPSVDLSGLERRLSALEEADGGGARIEALAARLGELEERLAGLPTVAPERIERLAERVTALGRQIEDIPRVDPAAVSLLTRDSERLAADLQQISERLRSLEARAADASAVLSLSQRVDAIAEIARSAARERGVAQSLLLAVTQLRAAVDAGQDFSQELQAVRALAANDDRVQAAADALADYAERGVPTRVVLDASLEELSGDIVRASVGPAEEGWWRETVQRLASLVTVRRVDAEGAGESTAAIVAKAEAAMEQGDIQTAVEFLSRLAGPPAAVAEPWLAAARARLAAEEALSNLSTHVIALAGQPEPRATE